MTSCAFEPIRYQGSLIINFFGRNRLIPSFDHYQYFISLYILSIIAGAHLVLTCFLLLYGLGFLINFTFRVAVLTDCSKTVQRLIFLEKGCSLNFRYNGQPVKRLQYESGGSLSGTTLLSTCVTYDEASGHVCLQE